MEQLRNWTTDAVGSDLPIAAISTSDRSADKTAIQRYPGKVCFRPKPDLGATRSEGRLRARIDVSVICSQNLLRAADSHIME